ncbi:transglutaminase domain-containing protein [Cohnella sp. AR92]|uniref:DUF4129 domain-containing transglutaminase family protein n=1 Tax=Cohnella sp. AR92 TaxID=648716 RepID=UPI0013156BE2|nr:transglutaminase domain-containing protein [Cohnella sp. AR92]
MSIALAEARPKENVLWRRLVLERLHRIFALILVLQLIQPFQDYWWPETFHVIYAALGIYGVTELLFTRILWVRILIQAVGALGSTFLFADADWQSWPATRDWESLRSFLTFNIEQMHPVIELAALTLLMCHVLAYWTATKGKAIIVMVAAVTTLAIIDSFFPFELWRSILWSVAAGLGWLVVLHLRMLREKHYDSWTAMAERPFELVLPALLVIGLLVVVGSWMPRAPVLLEDPYSMWLRSQDKEVPSFAGEGGELSNFISSSGGQMSSKSGYGRNDTQIGGGFQYDYSPVMEVATNLKSYLRGETKAVYTGKGWSDRKGQTSEQVFAGENAAKLPLVPELGSEAGTRKIEQTVTMLRKDRLAVLFSASPASQLVELNSSRNAQLFWNPDERELRFQRPASVESYTIVSEVQELDEERLRTLSAASGSGSGIPRDAYLQLPDSLPQRVRELAQSVTASATNDYDRLKSLEQYLRTTYPYTNTPDLSKQKSKDVVDAFLFEIQEGYCDYYSTSFVVMARTLGIPTRWVKGYTSGVNPAAQQEERYGNRNFNPDGAGTYTVRNADAHSWAEAYFEGYGWVSFEPTSGFSIPVPVPKEVTPEATQTVVEATAEPLEQPNAQGGGMNVSAILWSVGAVVAVVLLAAIYLILRRRGGVGRAIRQLRHLGATPNQRIVKEMESLVRFMQRRGFKRSKHETLRETFHQWGGRFGSLKPEFEGALIQFEGARYGSGQGEEETYREFSRLTERIRKAL